jgi:hypothetical protein
MQPELIYQLHHIQITGEPVMIETVEFLAADIECASQSTNFAFRFQDRYRDAPFYEFISGGQTGKPRTDYCHLGFVIHFPRIF